MWQGVDLGGNTVVTPHQAYALSCYKGKSIGARLKIVHLCGAPIPSQTNVKYLDATPLPQFRSIAGEQEDRASESVSRSSFSTARNRLSGFALDQASSWVSSGARPQVRSTERR